MPYTRREPRTKEELLDRMLAHDFDGDLKSVVGEGTSIVREAANKVLIHTATGRSYELVVRLPRTENARDEGRSFAPPGGEQEEWRVEPEEAPRGRRRQSPEGRHQTRERPSPRV